MKHSKRILSTLMVTLMLISMPSIGIAHSGRTDSRGGHRDNKNKSGLGSYHYHCGGHPAHLHEDGVCPYDGSSRSKSSSKSSSSKSKSDTYRTAQKTKLYQEADKESDVLSSIPEGTKLNAIEHTEYFAKVEYDGHTGYVRLKHCK